VAEPTLFFLPHCEAWLCNALLDENWAAGLSHLALIGETGAQGAGVQAGRQRSGQADRQINRLTDTRDEADIRPGRQIDRRAGRPATALSCRRTDGRT
jgi:hypothetical protein